MRGGLGWLKVDDILQAAKLARACGGTVVVRNGGGVTLHVETRDQAVERVAFLEVADQGPGMTAEQAAHVFDRFYRGEASRLDGGSGLGLFIVARLAHTFGGRVSVDTDVGRGSTFKVVLPLYPDDPGHAGDPGTGPSPAARPAAQHDDGAVPVATAGGREREPEDAGVD